MKRENLLFRIPLTWLLVLAGGCVHVLLVTS